MRRAPLVILGGVLVAIDLASKYVLRNQAHQNTLGAFSLPFPEGPTLALAAITLAGLVFALLRVQSHLVALGITLVIAGGVSNLLERLLTGIVTDITHIGSLSLNVGDIYVLGGAIIVVVALFKRADSEAVQ